MYRLKRAFIIFLLLVFYFPFSQAEDKQVYSVYVVPQISPVLLHKNWSPFLDLLGHTTGLKFELKIQKSIPAFEEKLFSGQPDFSFMNPYHQVIAKQKHGYLPLIRDAKKKLIGILVVRDDSTLQSIEQLNGQTLAFPAPNAFAASLYTRALLAKQNISVFPQYVKTHSNVYRHVLFGDVIAGGGVNNTLERETKNVKKQLRIIYQTPPSAPHPFSVHPRVPVATQTKVKEAFLALAKDPANQNFLNKIQIPQPMLADYARDYHFLDELELDAFFVMSGNLENPPQKPL